MLIARRLYVYFVAAVSLAVLAVGFANLLRLGLEQLWRLPGGVLPGGALETRQQLSLYTALVVVSLPLWLLHWRLAQRAAGERSSEIRTLYLALALLLSLAFWLGAAYRLVEHLVRDLLGPAHQGADLALPQALAVLLVAGAIWLYHLQVARRDLAGGALPAPATQPLRLYLYLAALAGALLLLFGVAALLHLLLDVLLPGRVLTTAPSWWIGRLSGDMALVAVGLLAWAPHWDYAERAIDGAAWWAEQLRRSLLRRLYLYVLLAVSVFTTLIGLDRGLDLLLRWLLGAERGTSPGLRVWELLDPLVGAAPFALAWVYHRSLLREEEQAGAEDRRQAATRRLYSYLVALVGLALGAAGATLLLGALLDLADGGRPGASPGWWRGELSRDLALAAIGATVWLWQWRGIQRRVASPGPPAPAERASTVRRAYLYLVIAVALIGLLQSLAVNIYLVMVVILAVRSRHGFLAGLSSPLSLAIVAAMVVLYHLMLLRRDQAFAQPSGRGPQRRELIITAPPGTDLDALLASLRAQLPSDVSLSTGSDDGGSDGGEVPRDARG